MIVTGTTFGDDAAVGSQLDGYGTLADHLVSGMDSCSDDDTFAVGSSGFHFLLSVAVVGCLDVHVIESELFS